MSAAERRDLLVEAVFATGNCTLEEAQDIADDIIATTSWRDILAAERKATVERIRAAVNGPGFTRWATAAYADDPTLLDAPEWAVDEAALLVILDAEAAR